MFEDTMKWCLFLFEGWWRSFPRLASSAREHPDFVLVRQQQGDIILIISIMDSRVSESARQMVLLPVVVPVSVLVSTESKHTDLKQKSSSIPVNISLYQAWIISLISNILILTPLFPIPQKCIRNQNSVNSGKIKSAVCNIKQHKCGLSFKNICFSFINIKKGTVRNDLKTE